jgi:hypothetical protein
MPALQSSPVAIAPANAAVAPPRVAEPALVAASRGAGGRTERAAAEPHPAAPIDARPEVYCRQHGMAHAARGFAPCSDLGCTGCTSR